jgi:hypothetical protein
MKKNSSIQASSQPNNKKISISSNKQENTSQKDSKTPNLDNHRTNAADTNEQTDLNNTTNNKFKFNIEVTGLDKKDTSTKFP